MAHLYLQAFSSILAVSHLLVTTISHDGLTTILLGWVGDVLSPCQHPTCKHRRMAALMPFSSDHGAAALGWVIAEWPEAAELLAGWHADPDVRPFLLTVESGDLIGYGEVWVDAEENEAELARLVIDPPFRGKGHGRQLTRLLTAEARRLGFSDVWLRVVPENAPAIACYHAAGFIRATADEEAAFNVGQPRAYVWMRGGTD
jgi:ribosomal protein S18 acetylase RimI-like enzyme